MGFAWFLRGSSWFYVVCGRVIECRSLLVAGLCGGLRGGLHGGLHGGL